MDEGISIQVGVESIDPEHLLAWIADPDCGAHLLFLGTTRRTTGEQLTQLLDYHAYLPMAEVELRRIAAAALERWPLKRIAIQHRLGPIPIGQASVAVAACSPHRPAVMEGVPWIMDQLKTSVPIWKKETRDDGSQQWIHP